MSLVLLVGAGLLVRSFVALHRMPLGFEPHGLVAADVIMRFRRDWSLETRVAYRNEIVNRLRATPGMTAATVGIMPGEGWRSGAPLETERDASGNSRRVSEFATIFAGPGYFRITGMRLIAGRAPDPLALPPAGGNGQQAISQEVVVSRSTARRLWPDGRVIGARLYSNAGGRGISETYTVVGVVEDIQIAGHRMATGLVEIYQPPPARLPGYATILLRTTLPEREVVPSIRRIVADFSDELRIASGMPAGALVQQVTIGDRYLSESLAPARFAMALLAAFATIALVLSGVGLYGVIAYSVTQRTREIGVRVALGADARSVKRLIVGGGLRLTTLGVVLGVVAAVASTRVLASLLYGVGPVDPLSFVAIALLVVAIAFAACYVPARRAMRVDPMEALRTD